MMLPKMILIWPPHGLLHGSSGALVGNMHHVDAGPLLQHFAGKVLATRYARRRIEQSAGTGLGLVDEVRQRLGRKRGMHRDDVGRALQVDDGCDVLHRVVGQLVLHGGIGRVRVDDKHADGVCIGGPDHDLGADDECRAGPVLDDNGLTELCGEGVLQ
jgi:hypothetical protein